MTISLGVQQVENAHVVNIYDVIVLGAGPYGLSAAAHLRAHGLKVAIFGKPLQFWRQHMPKGMLLRSYWWATSLSDPQHHYDMAHYFQELGSATPSPLPIETFIAYGLWFQQHVIPDVDETYISMIERKDEQFTVTLADGRVIRSRTVIMAPGMQYYTYYPYEYRNFPSSLVSHSSEHHDLRSFAGQRVAVIGRGQASLETAALLHENGAAVRVISRQPIRWLPVANSAMPAFLRELRAPKAGMGCGWLNWILEKYPYFFQSLPRNTRDHIINTRHGPAGSTWLKARLLDKVTFHESVAIENITPIHNHIRLALSTGSALEVDHVILGTGYRADIQRLTMLHPSLISSMKTYIGSPVLSRNFESSVPGLYFIGYSSVRSFGPFYRFVIGDEAAARCVSSAIVRSMVH